MSADPSRWRPGFRDRAYRARLDAAFAPGRCCPGALVLPQRREYPQDVLPVDSNSVNVTDSDHGVAREDTSADT